ncbi:MAG: sugar phosphate isomerase/epimerase family protein [Chthoniobacteraceae bacterium]
MNQRRSLGFSTLGNPLDSLLDSNRLASQFGLQFLELRSLEGSLDLPGYFERQPLPAASVPILVIDTSLCLLTAEAKEVEDFYRFAELAKRLHTPYLRVFGRGGEEMGEALSSNQLDQMAHWVFQIRQTFAQRKWRCKLLLETHDIFSSAQRCLALNNRLDVPLEILWDAHHTWRFSGEHPGQTWRQIGPWIAHIHYKDSIGVNNASEKFSYVAPGKGDYPTGALLETLFRAAYTGGISLEWEKMWHPELASINTVLMDFCRIFQPEEPRQ